MSRKTAKAEAMNNARRAASFIIDRLDAFKASNRLSKSSIRFLDSVTTGSCTGNHAPISNVELAAAVTGTMVDALFQHHDSHKDRPNHRYWLGTICIDDGVTSLFDPEVDLKRIKAKVDKMMRRHGLHGVFLIEVVILLDSASDLPDRLLFHIHMACWKVGEKFQPRKLAKKIMEGKGFTNGFGARAVVFRRCDMSDRKIAGLAYYTTKVEACVERLRPSQVNNGGVRFQRDQGAYTPKLVTRMAEVTSYMHMYDAVHGVGEGADVRARWKESLEIERRKKVRGATWLPRDYAPDREWAKLWSECGDNRFNRCRIIG